MVSKKVFRPRNLGMIVVLLILMAMIYGFAAQNTLTVNPLGDATATVNGYTVTVGWDFYTADSDPSTVEDADLTFTVAPNEAYIQVYNSNTTSWSAWIDCGADGSSTSLTCALPASFPTEFLTQVRVAAR